MEISLFYERMFTIMFTDAAISNYESLITLFYIYLQNLLLQNAKLLGYNNNY